MEFHAYQLVDLPHIARLSELIASFWVTLWQQVSPNRSQPHQQFES